MKKIFALLIVFSVLLSACSAAATSTPAPQTNPFEDVPPIVSATGEVVPAEWATLSAPGGGLIVDFPLAVDDTLTADALLMRLQGQERLQAAVAAAQFELTSAQQALDDLYKDPELPLAQAEFEIAAANRAVDDAQRRLNNLGSNAKAVDIDQARATVVLLKDRLDKARKDYAPYENKAESNVTRAALLSKLTEAQRAYDAAVSRLNNLLGTASDLDVADAQAALTLAQARLAVAQRRYQTLQNGPDPDVVALAQARIANAQTQLTAAQAALADLELRAPFGGSVVETYVHAGEWINPGQPVLLLADLTRLRVETTDLSEIDVARVRVGDSVSVTFDALPDVVVTGTVTRIAGRAAQGAGVNYTVEIELDEIPVGLRWGMTAFVDIQVEK